MNDQISLSFTQNIGFSKIGARLVCSQVRWCRHWLLRWSLVPPIRHYGRWHWRDQINRFFFVPHPSKAWLINPSGLEVGGNSPFIFLASGNWKSRGHLSILSGRGISMHDRWFVFRCGRLSPFQLFKFPLESNKLWVFFNIFLSHKCFFGRIEGLYELCSKFCFSLSGSFELFLTKLQLFNCFRSFPLFFLSQVLLFVQIFFKLLHELWCLWWFFSFYLVVLMLKYLLFKLLLKIETILPFLG